MRIGAPSSSKVWQFVAGSRRCGSRGGVVAAAEAVEAGAEGSYVTTILAITGVEP